MKGPENIPIDTLASTATNAEVIAALNKVIKALNFMWEDDEPIPPSEE